MKKLINPRRETTAKTWEGQRRTKKGKKVEILIRKTKWQLPKLQQSEKWSLKFDRLLYFTCILAVNFGEKLLYICVRMHMLTKKSRQYSQEKRILVGLVQISLRFLLLTRLVGEKKINSHEKKKRNWIKFWCFVWFLHLEYVILSFIL